MGVGDVTSHFWVAGAPFFSTTLLVVPALGDDGDVRTVTTLEFFDVDGVKTNSVEVEFPSEEVGIIELEPFAANLKMEGGVQHGHVAISSPSGTKHLCRLSIGQNACMLPEPLLLRARESCFLPVVLASRREHMLVMVNAGLETAQISARLFYGHRSPEWNLTVPPNGAKLVPMEDELLSSADEKGWDKGTVQGYLRLSSRHQAAITCFMIERMAGEAVDQDVYRCLTSW
jgi:hypothetical protein